MQANIVEDLLGVYDIPYVMHEHAPAETLEERRALGFPFEQTVKTLAFTDRKSRQVLLAALLTGDRLDYSLAAAAFGTQRGHLSRLEPEALRTRLGVVSGGVAPLPVAPDVKVVLDCRVAVLTEPVYTGAGRSDRTLEILVRDLASVPAISVRPIVAPVISP